MFKNKNFNSRLFWTPVLLGLMMALFPHDGFCCSTTLNEKESKDTVQLLLHEPFITDAQKAIELMYNFEYEASIQILNPWMVAYPENPIWSFWDGLPIWWDILSDLENEANDERFINHMEMVDNKANKLLRNDRRNADALVIKALTNGFLARLHSNRESWYTSLSHARVSMNILFNLERLYPEIADVQFGMGLYDYFAAHLSEEYSLVRALSFMIPNGDKEQGLERLEKAAKESIFLIPEATYFLGHIHLHYENDYAQALHYLTDLTTNFPQNTFFQRLLLRTFYRNRRFQDAILLIDELHEKYADSDTEFALLEEIHTIRGNIYYRSFDHSNAEMEYLKVLSLESHFPNAQKRMLMTEARYRLALIYVESNRTVEAREQFQTIVRNRPDSDYFNLAKNKLKELR